MLANVKNTSQTTDTARYRMLALKPDRHLGLLSKRTNITKLVFEMITKDVIVIIIKAGTSE